MLIPVNSVWNTGETGGMYFYVYSEINKQITNTIVSGWVTIYYDEL